MSTCGGHGKLEITLEKSEFCCCCFFLYIFMKPSPNTLCSIDCASPLLLLLLTKLSQPSQASDRRTCLSSYYFHYFFPPYISYLLSYSPISTLPKSSLSWLTCPESDRRSNKLSNGGKKRHAKRQLLSKDNVEP